VRRACGAGENREVTIRGPRGVCKYTAELSRLP
jgi:hypothetical protein